MVLHALAQIGSEIWVVNLGKECCARLGTYQDDTVLFCKPIKGYFEDNFQEVLNFILVHARFFVCIRDDLVKTACLITSQFFLSDICILCRGKLRVTRRFLIPNRYTGCELSITSPPFSFLIFISTNINIKKRKIHMQW